MASKTSMIDDLSTNQKLDGFNYDMWHQKIQFLLNERKVLKHLTAMMAAPATKDKENKDILPLRSIRPAQLSTKNGARKVARHAILCCITCMTI